MREQLKRRVKAVIDEVNSIFGDTTVPRADTLSAMEEILNVVETNLAALSEGNGEDEDG